MLRDDHVFRVGNQRQGSRATQVLQASHYKIKIPLIMGLWLRGVCVCEHFDLFKEGEREFDYRGTSSNW